MPQVDPEAERMAMDESAAASRDGMNAVAQTIPQADEPLTPAAVNAAWAIVGPALERLSAGQIVEEPYDDITSEVPSVPPQLGTKIAAIGALTQTTPALADYKFDPIESMKTNDGLEEAAMIIDQMSRDKAVLKAMKQPKASAPADEDQDEEPAEVPEEG